MTCLESDLSNVRRLLGTGELEAAWNRGIDLTRRNPHDPSAWRLAAEVAERCGKLVEGEALLRRALDLVPDDGPTLIKYAQSLLRSGRRAEALAAASRAQALEAADPALDNALGALLTHLEEPSRALVHLERAVRASPGEVGFRYNLAMTQRMVGDLAAAETNLDRVIAARPQDGEAYHARSDLRRQTPERNHIPQLERALRALSGRRAALPVAFALAKELEDLGEFERSFACVHEACRAYRATLRYDVADDVAVLERLRARHTRSALRQAQSACERAESIFIVGLPRSGTTLVERILGTHSQVFAAGELDAFQRVAVEAVSRLVPGAISKLDFVDQSLKIDFTALSSDYFAATRPRTGHTAHFTDKMPLNYLYAGLIHAAVPRARFIALERHPLDSCYAMYKTLFAAAYPFTYDLMDLGRYYVAWARLVDHWQQIIGEAWRVVRYEELVSAQEAMSRGMLAHCRLPWEPECLDFHKHPGPVTSASAAQVRRPLYKDSVGKWRHYAERLEPLADYLRKQGISVD